MKSFTRSALIVTSVMALSATLASCGQNLPPTTNPSATPSPSASPSESSSPDPIPTAPPAETPSPEASATPSASATPFPSGTPMPVATPIPTPTPVYAPSSIPAGTTTALFNFRARVISENRQVLPVDKGEFTAVGYDLAQIQAELIAKNKVEAKPVGPSSNDPKYLVEQKVCTSSGCTTEQTVDLEAYQEDLSRYTKSILPEWEARAYAGQDEAIAKASAGRPSVSFSTDANGEAALRLPVGTWYFNGRYSASGAVVVWESIPFNITANTKSVELTR